MRARARLLSGPAPQGWLRRRDATVVSAGLQAGREQEENSKRLEESSKIFINDIPGTMAPLAVGKWVEGVISGVVDAFRDAVQLF